MPKMKWYRKIPLSTSRLNGRIRKRIAKAGDVTPRSVTIKNPHNIYRTKNLGTYHHIIGVRVKLFSLNDLSKFLNVNYHTMRRWHKDGALPVPFITFETTGKQQPMWIAGQINCFVRVLNDIYAAGYVSIPWRDLQEHTDMVEEGAAIAVERWNAKYTGVKEPLNVDKYGIELHD